MNLRSLLIIAPGALLLIAAIAFVSVNKDDGHGHGHHGHSHGHAHGDHNHSHAPNEISAKDAALDHQADWQSTFGTAPLRQIWLSVRAAEQAAQTALEAGELARVPDLVETIHLAAHAFYDKAEEFARAGADSQSLSTAFAQVVRLADAVLDHAQHGDLTRTRNDYARLSSAIGVAAIRLPEVILEGARLSDLPPITARASAHSHAH